MRQDRARHPLRVALLLQDLHAAKRMIRLIGPALVVEVVQQRHHAPVVLVLTPEPRVAAHRGFDREHVLPQALALRMLGDQRPRLIPRQHRAHDPHSLHHPPVRAILHPARDHAQAPCPSTRILEAVRVRNRDLPRPIPAESPPPQAGTDSRPARSDTARVLIVEHDAIEDLDHRPDIDAQPGLFRDLAATAASSVSPISTAPPGRLHSPASGWWPRLTRMTPEPGQAHAAHTGVTYTTAPTPTTGRAG